MLQFIQGSSRHVGLLSCFCSCLQELISEMHCAFLIKSHYIKREANIPYLHIGDLENALSYT